VVIAFERMEKKSLMEVKRCAERISIIVLDLYAKATQFFEEDKVRAGKLRGETLKAIERVKAKPRRWLRDCGRGVGFHLRTMARLDIFMNCCAGERDSASPFLGCGV